MKQTLNKKEHIWLAVFVVIPSIILTQLKDAFAISPFNHILLAGLFGLIGAVVGSLIYLVLKNQKTLIKTLSAIALSVLCIGTLIAVPGLTKPRLITCEVCGYKAINADSSECHVCGNKIWEKEKNNSIYSSKEEWIKEEQLFIFGMDSPNQRINFYQPSEPEGYEKDKNWKPSVTEQEIKEDFKNSHVIINGMNPKIHKAKKLNN